MRRFLKSRYTRGAISAVIFINAVVIGLLTVEEIQEILDEVKKNTGK